MCGEINRLPRFIHSEEENERCIATLEALHDRGNLSPEEDRLAELLTLLIEDFESKHYHLTPASPVQVIQELMAAHSLTQSDMVDIFGGKDIAGKVLAGEMDLTKSQIPPSMTELILA